MKKKYLVCRDSVDFGVAEINREGLYYRVVIRCPDSARVFVCGKNGIRDLGICVPSEGYFQMETRIPVKQIGEGEFSFWAESGDRNFYPVDSEKPFLHLDILRSCILTFRGGQIGIQRDISRPTGQ